MKKRVFREKYNKIEEIIQEIGPKIEEIEKKVVKKPTKKKKVGE